MNFNEKSPSNGVTASNNVTPDLNPTHFTAPASKLPFCNRFGLRHPLLDDEELLELDDELLDELLDDEELLELEDELVDEELLEPDDELLELDELDDEVGLNRAVTLLLPFIVTVTGFVVPAASPFQALN